MLSLLTYGATFGVAERVSTRHEIDAAEYHEAQYKRQHSGRYSGQYSGQYSEQYSEQYKGQFTASSPIAMGAEADLEKTNLRTGPEQPTTKGGVIGRLARLIQRQT